MGTTSIIFAACLLEMSSSASPITPQRFAKAILDLPLPTLHIKAAEIRNSISHLESSNFQLQKFADEGDRDCENAIKENDDTMLRMEERILMLRREVERRGFRWGGDVATENRTGRRGSNEQVESRGGPEDMVEHTNPNGGDLATQQGQTSNVESLGNVTLARRRLERVESNDEEVDDGVHL